MKTKRLALGAMTATVVAGVVMAGAVPAAMGATTAPTENDVTADGAVLSGSTQADGSFTLGVAAPAGVTVKFKVDGEYLGQDGSAPYSWPVSTTPGSHKANVRWDEGGERREITVPFTVASGSTGTTKPTPAPAPAPTPTSAPAPTAAPAPAPAPTKTPAPAPTAGTSTGTGSTIPVSTAAQLTAALKAAKPGQTIALKDGTYTGKFTAAASGTASAPITLTGSRKAVLTTGSLTSGYALNVTGDRWNITGLSVTRAAKGIVLDGSSSTVIDGVDVGSIGSEAIHLRANSANVTVKNSVVHDTGLAQPSYGEGVYIGSATSNWASVMGSSSTPDRSDSATVTGNTFRTIAAEGIDVKEGTTGGVITGNTFTNVGYSGENYADSWIDVKGNGYRISGNSGSGTKLDAFQVHVAIAGWGQGTVFGRNTVTGGVPGYEVSVQSGAAGTVVACGTTTAGKGLTNISCAR